MPARSTPAALARLADRLTARDYDILTAIHTHRLLTTHHIAALFFNDRHSRRARTRLTELHTLGALDRFRPPRHHGSAPAHWIIAPAGARALAHHRHIPVADLSYRHDHALAIAHSSRLAHTTGVLDCMVAFTTAARTTPEADLDTWWDEARCAAEWGTYTRPDAYLRWTEPTTSLDAFIEYDTGTETLDRVAAKLPGYAALAEATALATPLLIVTSSRIRETNLARRLAPHTTPQVPLWLTTRMHLDEQGPTCPIWRPTTDPSRHRLDQLA